MDWELKERDLLETKRHNRKRWRGWMSVCILNIRPSPVCVVWWRCKNAWSVSGREWRDHSCCFSPIGLMTSKSRKKCCSYEITAQRERERRSGENLEENPRWLWASAFAVVARSAAGTGRLPKQIKSRSLAWRFEISHSFSTQFSQSSCCLTPPCWLAGWQSHSFYDFVDLLSSRCSIN